MNSRTCRSCGAEMAPEDAFCPECGTHVSTRRVYRTMRARRDRRRHRQRRQPIRRMTGHTSASTTCSRRGLRSRPWLPVDDSGEPQPIRTFDAPVEVHEEDEYADYPETQEPRFSPVMLGLAAVFIAIIVAGVIIAFFGGSDDGGGSSSGSGLGTGLPSAGGFGSMLPDGTLVCAKGTPTSSTGPRTAVAGRSKCWRRRRRGPAATW